MAWYFARPQELNLSGNQLERIEGLNGLESLKRLVLANNKIRQIQGLDQLEALEKLELQVSASPILAGGLCSFTALSRRIAGKPDLQS